MSSPSILADRFGVDEVRVPEYEATYNVAPPGETLVVAVSRGKRVLDKVRWGLVPSWAKDLSIGDRQINARADSVATKAAYKRVRQAPCDRAGRRVLRMGEGRRPEAEAAVVHPASRRRTLAFAGLWEIWHDPNIGDDAPRIRTFTIITTDPNELVQPLRSHAGRAPRV